MSPQGIATTLFLPPLLLCLVCLLGVVAAAALRRGPWRRLALGLAAAAPALLLLLATPYVSGLLAWSLARGIAQVEQPGAGAIVILGADTVHGAAGAEVGPLTLERLRAGAALARRTGLGLMVTAGSTSPGAPPLAGLMARTLAQDFGREARWVEALARDTRENARLSARLLAAEGISSAYVVTHAWHMPRTLAAFHREGFAALPWPVRAERRPTGQASDWIPRADHLAMSWLALREWAGRAVYAVRDAAAAPVLQPWGPQPPAPRRQ